jgi:hypothetical protein
MKIRTKSILKKIVNLDSLVIIVTSMLLLVPLWFIGTVFVFPYLYPDIYDEIMELNIRNTGTLENWAATLELFPYVKGISERSFNLVLSNLSTVTSRCTIWFNIMPWYDSRSASATINAVVPQTNVDTSVYYDGGWVEVNLNYNEAIDLIDITITFTQSSPLENASKIPPYKEIYYQSSITSNQNVRMSKVTILSPPFLTVDTVEPRREVSYVHYQGLIRTIELVPQQAQERILVQFTRQTSSLIPLALNFVAMISIINLGFNLYQIIRSKVHRQIMIVAAIIILAIEIFIVWSLLQYFTF